MTFDVLGFNLNTELMAFDVSQLQKKCTYKFKGRHKNQICMFQYVILALFSFHCHCLVMIIPTVLILF